ncbi:RDD family protein [Marivibrio halodurans]|uniref:RDD family protein n=1 Tax=Marivibrio halodurans TaxID=2039722 RepID=A0A8J7V146_9PROT|nr:RDD family protein [Marivibrio halodurans]MBP5855930.1 RDD family protein [Marivibrio halodurans]
MAGRNIDPHGTARRGFTLGGHDSETDIEDRLRDPALTEGTVLRRVVGYAIDVVILAAIGFAIHLVVFMTLGLLAPLLYPLLVVLPLIYHTYFVQSAASATIGQRLAGLEVRRLDGGRPGPLQAFVMVCLFYLTLALTSGLLLLWCLIDDRGRCLHDILSGTLVLRGDRVGA